MPGGGDGCLCLKTDTLQAASRYNGIVGRPAVEAGTAKAGSDRPGPPQSLPQNDAVLDWSDALANVRGDRELLRSMARAFLEELPRLMATMRQAVAHQDRAALRLAAHTLKGSTHYFGAHRAFESAFRLETMAREGDFADAERCVAALEAEMVQLTPAVSRYAIEPVRSRRRVRVPIRSKPMLEKRLPLTKVLVVDDSAVDRALVSGLLEKSPDLDVQFAVNGREGLAMIESLSPTS